MTNSGKRSHKKGADHTYLLPDEIEVVDRATAGSESPLLIPKLLAVIARLQGEMVKMWGEEERLVLEAAKRAVAKYATVPDLDRLREAVAALETEGGIRDE